MALKFNPLTGQFDLVNDALEITSESIAAALGFTPADSAVIGDIEALLNAINGETP
jgi:hypothetical protein